MVTEEVTFVSAMLNRLENGNEFCICIYFIGIDKLWACTFSAVSVRSSYVPRCFSREKLRVDFAKAAPWSMSQFRRIFNCCKTPGETVDAFNHYFKTGGCSVLCSSGCSVLCSIDSKWKFLFLETVICHIFVLAFIFILSAQPQEDVCPLKLAPNIQRSTNSLNRLYVLWPFEVLVWIWSL